ncbi:hypothetical protein EGW08_000610, partial [Elysia chlorotica]
MLYCVVPKAGCTFWKRIFRSFETKTNPRKEDVFNISRASVHDALDGGKGSIYSLWRHGMDRFPTRLLVTRDPYSRLISTYLDKIYLPDFWNYESKEIANGLNLRRGFRGGIFSLGEDSNSDAGQEDEFENNDDFLRLHFKNITNTPEFSYMRMQNQQLHLQPHRQLGKSHWEPRTAHGKLGSSDVEPRESEHESGDLHREPRTSNGEPSNTELNPGNSNRKLGKSYNETEESERELSKLHHKSRTSY